MPTVAFRLLHTSDWHLGRALHEEPLLADQAWALDRLIALARDARPDAVVVAGDVYDRAVPPSEAVTLLDDVLTRLAELGAPVVVIAGNHDSGDRLSFGARLLARRGVHLRGVTELASAPVEVPGKGLLYPMPFVDPEVVRGLTGDEALRGHAAATERLVSGLRADAATRSLPAVLVAHAFVQGALQTPDSERPIVVGNAGSIPVEAVAGFDYVALGHLHAAQAVSAAIRYSGSLLKYSFAEAEQEKGVVLVEVERGRASARVVPLGARRDVVRLRGTLQQLLQRPELARHRGDLVEATLEDPGYVLDAKLRLQERFPHVVSVVRAELAAGGAQGSFGRQVAGAGRDDLKLFEAFFSTVAGAEPDPAQRQLFAEALAAADRAERGA
jgi:DNA repair protein SbcD/Mre11